MIIKLLILSLLYKLYVYLVAKPVAKYQSKRVIVTGASSGIGVQLAKQYAQMKCRVAIVARRTELLENVKREIVEATKIDANDILIVSADLTDEKSCKAMVEKVVGKWGGVDLCVCNAGAGSLVEFEKLDGDFSIFHQNMDINFFSVVYTTGFVLPYLKQSNGSLVVVSSLAGKFGTALRSSYSASKHALHGFLNSLRNELEGKVQITIVCPGFVQTEFHEKAKTTTGKPIERESKHFMTPDKCAEAIILAERLKSREVLLGLKAKVGYYLLPFVPGFIDYMSNKQAKASIKKDE
ncbi:short-chain dehydrogenase/reductase family protein [Cavenderia fasciculata]|uniref:Short-chain dehydrogenase/reductase family protein n=1 Tax=Cavenderia fasciculata TaxID=261658 RepID=F4QDY9_CACFS|nr:short-chain dehydrogenase/reductase family protein [Cavenderia fasciculata]EGG13936.1 short-chain dehydrogenase/reductase family protein [Cavenderia fasciculata]|eukprot:XP_004350644.1 short-chain dehydrogenase/reductase family protein [Cavenderia fasciculata]